ncbi:tRNA-dihydrouridine synthase [Spirochaetota bacterium]|nr:tRNA-dihydrouridine synthase [Spirochaetota bacterium]
MIDLETFKWDRAVLLAPMEEVTDLSYRKICRELGAELVYTEFVNSDGLIRGCRQGRRKMAICDAERPIGIQIYGNDTKTMVEAACLAEELAPDLIDINAGCWVKKVSRRGAGAGLLKDPCFMEEMIRRVVKAVKVPVTVKTRIGWDEHSINIIDIAKRLEGVGVRALTIHCRTRAQGHSGMADWSWIDKVKDHVKFPVIVNGGILTAADALRAFRSTRADGVMIARGALGTPWVFREIKEMLKLGSIRTPISLKERIDLCLEHLRNLVLLKGERRALLSFRKYYSGYFRNIANISSLRMALMQQITYQAVADLLRSYEVTGNVSYFKEVTTDKEHYSKKEHCSKNDEKAIKKATISTSCTSLQEDPRVSKNSILQ